MTQNVSQQNSIPKIETTGKKPAHDTNGRCVASHRARSCPDCRPEWRQHNADKEVP